ncbi:hypothetical protein COU20_00090, partial [Candidatus Kaiserbacteria bacterium CG10_big_fil_rev_8_21_14_0_10_59_10]
MVERRFRERPASVVRPPEMLQEWARARRPKRRGTRTAAAAVLVFAVCAVGIFTVTYAPDRSVASDHPESPTFLQWLGAKVHIAASDAFSRIGARSRASVAQASSAVEESTLSFVSWLLSKLPFARTTTAVGPPVNEPTSPSFVAPPPPPAPPPTPPPPPPQTIIQQPVIERVIERIIERERAAPMVGVSEEVVEQRLSALR